MRRKIFLSVLLTILGSIHSEVLNAQYLPLVNESKYWIYYDFQARPRPTTGFLITIKGDTIVQNTSYKKVYKYELSGEVKTILINEPPIFVADKPYHLIDKRLVSLIREDTIEKRIFNLPVKQVSCTPTSGIINTCNNITFCDTLEHLLFDFSLSTGDTLNYCSYAPLHYSWEIVPEKIDSIKLEMYYGKLRKTFFTYGVASYLPNLDVPGPKPSSQVKIIEGIGFLDQGIFNYRYGSLVDYCEGDFDNCDIISATNELTGYESEVKVFPSPVYDFLKIESSEKIINISLFNANGILVISLSNENQINLSDVPNGFYICSIELDNGSVLTKKVIKMSR